MIRFTGLWLHLTTQTNNAIHDTQSIHNNDIHCLFHRLLILLSTLCFSKSSQDLLLVSNIVCLCIIIIAFKLNFPLTKLMLCSYEYAFVQKLLV